MSFTHTPQAKQDLYIPPLSEAQHPVVQWLYNILPETPPTRASPKCKQQTGYAKTSPTTKRLRCIGPSLQERGILGESSGNRRPMASPKKGTQLSPRRSYRLLASRPAEEPSTPHRNDQRAFRDIVEDIFEDDEETPQGSYFSTPGALTAATTLPPPNQPNFFAQPNDAWKKPLKKTNTSSRTRTSSPSKNDTRSTSPIKKRKETDLVLILRGAIPSVIYDIFPVVQQRTPIPPAVSTLLRNLVGGIQERTVLVCFKDRLQQADLISALGLASHDYDTGTNMDEVEAESVWEFVHLTVHAANSCQVRKQDESAWCYDVVSPLMKHAVGKPFKAMFEIKSIQTQTISSDYMPTIQGGLSIDKKVDFAWCFSPSLPVVQQYYDALWKAGDLMTLSQMKDNYTSRLALFCGAEVKTSTGDPEEGLAQLALWLSAGLRKYAELRRIANGREEWWKQRQADEQQGKADVGEKKASMPLQKPYSASNAVRSSYGSANDKPALEKALEKKSSRQKAQSDELPLLGWVIHGHTWSLYVAWTTNDNADTQIAGPVSFLSVNTLSHCSVFKLIALLKQVEKYGRETHWPWLEKEIFKKLEDNPKHKDMPLFLGGGFDGRSESESESISASETVSSG